MKFVLSKCYVYKIQVAYCVYQLHCTRWGDKSEIAQVYSVTALQRVDRV